MKSLKIILITALVLGFQHSFAQKNFTLYNMKTTPQGFYANPSFMPKAKLYLSLPVGMVNFGISNSGFSFNDALSKRADDSLAFNAPQLISSLAKMNYLTAESQIELFGLGIKVKDSYLSFSMSNRFQMNFKYPKDLMQLAFEGNGKSFLGQRASLDGLGFDMTSYMEYAFGYSKEINDKLSVGGRFKLISGLANIKTKKSQLGLYTDPTTFALTLDGSAEINTSNISQFYDSTSNFTTSDLSSNAYNFQNKGVGIDLGATYHINDKISVSASLLDLGSISWTANVTEYKSNDINFTFDGIDLNKYIADTSANPLDNFSDTLKQVFRQEESHESYSTALIPKFYLGGNYELTKNFNAGVLIYNEFIKGSYRPGISLSANATVKNWLVASLNYSIYNRSFANIGFGLSMKGGPIQFYFMTDNILALMMPKNSKNFHICGGISIYIKAKGEKENNQDKDKGTEIK